MVKRKRSVLLAGAVAGVLGVTGIVNRSCANSYTWNGTVSNSWELSTNWTPNTEPGSGDFALFPALASGTSVSAPLVDQADSVAGLSIDNSGGYIWNINRSGTGTDPRSLSIGSLGLSISGGGDTQWYPNSTTLAANQTWFVDANTTLTFNGGVLAGSGVLNKTGMGELDLTTNGSTNNAGINIDAGLVTNARSTNGDGTGVLSVYNGGTYEASNGNIGNTGGIILYNGGVLQGLGSAAGIAGGTISVDATSPGSVVTILAKASSDNLGISAAILGTDPTSVIDIAGSGTITPGGETGATSFQGTWSIGAGATLHALNNNSLGDHGTTVNNSSVALPSNVNLNGGTLQLAGTTSSSTEINFNNPVTVTADSTILVDEGAVKSVATSFTAATRQLGSLSIGNNTLYIGKTANVTGVQTAGAPANIGVSTLELSGTPTINVNPGTTSFQVALTANYLTQSSSTNGITETGSGIFAVRNANTSFNGPINVQSGTLQALAKGAFGSGTITLASGSTALFANGLTGWTSSNSFAGTGLVQVEGGTSSISLSGGTISPGTSSGAAGILTFAGPIALAKNGSTAGVLNINVAGSGGVAGTDFSQVVETNSSSTGVTGLSNYNLLVSVASAVTSTTTVKIISDPGVTNTAFADMTAGVVASADVTPGYSATVSDATVGEVDLTITPTPEPTSAALMLVGGAYLASRRRNRRYKQT